MWLAKYKTAVFVNGCFWHRHMGCKYAYMPKSNVEFWSQKFKANCERDIRVERELREKGIRILIVWECAVRKMMRSEELWFEVLEKIKLFLESDQNRLEI